MKGEATEFSGRLRILMCISHSKIYMENNAQLIGQQ